MTEIEFEAWRKDAGISRKEAQEILDNPLEVCERLVAQAKKDSPRMFTKFLERQNEQLSKIFRNEHKD